MYPKFGVESCGIFPKKSNRKKDEAGYSFVFFLPFSLSPLEYFSFIPTLYKRYRKDTGRVQKDRKTTQVQTSTNPPQSRKIYYAQQFNLFPLIIFLLNYYLLIHFYFVPL